MKPPIPTAVTSKTHPSINFSSSLLNPLKSQGLLSGVTFQDQTLVSSSASRMGWIWRKPGWIGRKPGWTLLLQCPVILYLPSVPPYSSDHPDRRVLCNCSYWQKWEGTSLVRALCPYYPALECGEGRERTALSDRDPVFPKPTSGSQSRLLSLDCASHDAPGCCRKAVRRVRREYRPRASPGAASATAPCEEALPVPGRAPSLSGALPSGNPGSLRWSRRRRRPPHARPRGEGAAWRQWRGWHGPPKAGPWSPGSRGR